MLKGTLLSTAIDLVQISGSVVQNYGHLHHFAVGNCQLVEITSFAPLCGGIALRKRREPFSSLPRSHGGSKFLFFEMVTRNNDF